MYNQVPYFNHTSQIFVFKFDFQDPTRKKNALKICLFYLIYLYIVNNLIIILFCK